MKCTENNDICLRGSFYCRTLYITPSMTSCEIGESFRVVILQSCRLHYRCME